MASSFWRQYASGPDYPEARGERKQGVSADALPNQCSGRFDVVSDRDGTADEDPEEHHAGNVLDRCDIEHEASPAMPAHEVRRLPSQRGFTVRLDFGADGYGK